MQVPLHYQVSEYDCVPTTLVNAVSYLFRRKEIPPMVIRHIFLYCLDTVGREARFGIGGTSKYAVRLVGNWLNNYKMKHFSVYTEFWEQEAVDFSENGRAAECLGQGGVVLCNMLLTPKEEHYVLIMAMDNDWVYCFDPYRRKAIRGMKGRAKILALDDGRSPNLKIKKEWFLTKDPGRFCLGPVSMRETLLVWRT
ncbi:MAG TPA: hypothetical protein DHV36_10530 [Desulfobacteraceae bacterium]|nr:hypothetical protein [Desulfobacteraceae bacterium]